MHPFFVNSHSDIGCYCIPCDLSKPSSPLEHTYVKLFTSEFLNWTIPSLNMNTSIVANRVSVKISNRMANSVDPDEMAPCELSHRDLHFLQKWSFGSCGPKWLNPTPSHYWVQFNSFTLSLPQAIMIGFCKQHRSR